MPGFDNALCSVIFSLDDTGMDLPFDSSGRSAYKLREKSDPDSYYQKYRSCSLAKAVWHEQACMF